jgi:hypothetical protein
MRTWEDIRDTGLDPVRILADIGCAWLQRLQEPHERIRRAESTQGGTLVGPAAPTSPTNFRIWVVTCCHFDNPNVTVLSLRFVAEGQPIS